ncbi:ComF family protein [Erythrobacter lutimaris]|nr:ComF family protein [Alteriqipengyuania lutimaris]
MLEFPGQPACSRCQIPLSGRWDGEQCGACLAHAPSHSGVSAAVLYTEPARQIVLRFKHGGRIGLATLMARLIAARLPEGTGEAVLVPVPLHRTRLWLRGYNQAALLAQALARESGRVVAVDALSRTRATSTLGGLGKAARARELRGAIIANRHREGSIAGKDVVLVDDVLTSGATNAACTGALLGAGARSVHIACFARVMDASALKRETPETNMVPGAA